MREISCKLCPFFGHLECRRNCKQVGEVESTRDLLLSEVTKQLWKQQLALKCLKNMQFSKWSLIKKRVCICEIAGIMRISSYLRCDALIIKQTYFSKRYKIHGYFHNLQNSKLSVTLIFLAIFFSPWIEPTWALDKQARKVLLKHSFSRRYSNFNYRCFCPPLNIKLCSGAHLWIQNCAVVPTFDYYTVQWCPPLNIKFCSDAHLWI